MANSINVLAAGSLRLVWEQLTQAFTEATGTKVKTEFGPAGLLRQRIEQGEKTDLFASANTAHPLAIQQQGRALEVNTFCGNSLCLVARDTPELDGLNWLSVLLDSRFRLATSTPQSDPSGDYTLQMFEEIERRHPGSGEGLRNKALRLVGGPNSAAVPAGKLASEWLICSGQTDLFIGYTSYARLLRENDIETVVGAVAEGEDLHVAKTVVAGKRLAVEEDAFAALCRKLFIEHRQRHHANHRLLAFHQPQRNAPQRRTAQEVRGAVDWVDNPAGRVSQRAAKLFANNGILREMLGELSADKLLHRDVGL